MVVLWGPSGAGLRLSVKFWGLARSQAWGFEDTQGVERGRQWVVGLLGAPRRGVGSETLPGGSYQSVTQCFLLCVRFAMQTGLGVHPNSPERKEFKPCAGPADPR